MTVEQLRDDLWHYDKDAQVIIMTPDILNVPHLSNIIGVYNGKMVGQQEQLILVGDREENKQDE